MNTNTTVTDVKNALQETKEVLRKNGYLTLPITLIEKWLDEFYADYVEVGGTKVKYQREEN